MVNKCKKLRKSRLVIPAGNCANEFADYVCKSRKICDLEKKQNQWQCQYLLKKEVDADEVSTYRFTCDQIKDGLLTCNRAQNQWAEETCRTVYFEAKRACKNQFSIDNMQDVAIEDYSSIKEIDFKGIGCKFFELELFKCYKLLSKTTRKRCAATHKIKLNKCKPSCTDPKTPVIINMPQKPYAISYPAKIKFVTIPGLKYRVFQKINTHTERYEFKARGTGQIQEFVIEDPINFKGNTHAEIYVRARGECGKYSMKSEPFIICNDAESKLEVINTEVQAGQDIIFLIKNTELLTTIDLGYVEIKPGYKSIIVKQLKCTGQVTPNTCLIPANSVLSLLKDGQVVTFRIPQKSPCDDKPKSALIQFVKRKHYLKVTAGVSGPFFPTWNPPSDGKSEESDDELVEEECTSPNKSVKLKGVIITNSVKQQLSYPLDIVYFSSDFAREPCIIFEIRMEIVGQGWFDPIPVNQQSKLRHNIPSKPDIEQYGSLNYQIRSRKGDTVSDWSSSFTICDNEKTKAAPLNAFFTSISASDQFNFSVQLPASQAGSFLLFEYYTESVRKTIEIRQQFINISYNQVIADLRVKETEQVSFRYAVVNACGLVGNYSEPKVYRLEDMVFVEVKE